MSTRSLHTHSSSSRPHASVDKPAAVRRSFEQKALEDKPSSVRSGAPRVERPLGRSGASRWGAVGPGPAKVCRVEELFRENHKSGAPLHFGPFAAADTNGDGELTYGELSLVPGPSGLPLSEMLNRMPYIETRLIPRMFYLDGEVYPESSDLSSLFEEKNEFDEFDYLRDAGF